MDNKMAEVLKDTMLHKQLVLQSCWKMANYFIEQGEEEKAIEIIRRGWTHDDSKFTKEEMECLILINDDYCSMRHAGCQLPEHMKEYLQLHYRNNTHHPEHWEDVSQMPYMDVCEMVCDWHARSIQFGTDLIEFAKIRQLKRFHFPDYMFQEILKFCKVLVGL